MTATCQTFHNVKAGADFTAAGQAGAGIEPANRGFADLDLTTWLPRQIANRSVGARSGGVNALRCNEDDNRPVCD